MTLPPMEMNQVALLLNSKVRIFCARFFFPCAQLYEGPDSNLFALIRNEIRGSGISQAEVA